MYKLNMGMFSSTYCVCPVIVEKIGKKATGEPETLGEKHREGIIDRQMYKGGFFRFVARICPSRYSDWSFSDLLA